MRQSFISRTLAAGVLASAVAGGVVAQPAHAAVTRTARVHAYTAATQPPQCHSVAGRDTTGSCRVKEKHQPVVLPTCKGRPQTCKPQDVKVPASTAYPRGLEVLVPAHVPGKKGIQKGDTVNVTVDATGRIAITVTQMNGQARLTFDPPLVLKAPKGYKILEQLGRDGKYHRVRGAVVSKPGLYKWTR